MRVIRTGVAVVAVAVVAGAVAAGSAEAQHWRLESQVGRLDFQLAEGADPAMSVGVGLAHDAPAARLRLTAGIPTAAEEPLWGALDGWRRLSLERGRVTLGMDLGGQVFGQRYESSFEEDGGLLGPPTVTTGVTYGYGLAAQAMPLVAVRAGAIEVEGRAGASHYRTAIGEVSGTRNVTAADVRVMMSPHAALAVGGEGRWFGTPEGDRPYAGLVATAALPAGAVFGSVGHWFDDIADARPWSAGALVRVGSRIHVTADVRQDGLDPQYGTAPRRSWGVGLGVRLTDPPAPARPVPARYADGVATVEIPARGLPDGIRIAGDFNDWAPAPMRRAGDRWVFTAVLDPGVYEYAFVAPDGTWFVPASVPGRRDDGMGGHVAILVVEGAGR